MGMETLTSQQALELDSVSSPDLTLDAEKLRLAELKKSLSETDIDARYQKVCTDLLNDIETILVPSINRPESLDGSPESEITQLDSVLPTLDNIDDEVQKLIAETTRQLQMLDDESISSQVLTIKQNRQQFQNTINEIAARP